MSVAKLFGVDKLVEAKVAEKIKEFKETLPIATPARIEGTVESNKTRIDGHSTRIKELNNGLLSQLEAVEDKLNGKIKAVGVEAKKARLGIRNDSLKIQRSISLGADYNKSQVIELQRQIKKLQGHPDEDLKARAVLEKRIDTNTKRISNSSEATLRNFMQIHKNTEAMKEHLKIVGMPTEKIAHKKRPRKLRRSKSMMRSRKSRLKL